MRISHSRVESFERCPKQYEYRYKDRLKVVANDDPQSPLVLGSALHEGLEHGVDAAIAYYRSKYFSYNDKHVHEEIKLAHYVELGRKQLPKGQNELKLEYEDQFIGYIDLVETMEDGTVRIWDFKYANPKSADRYKDSRQLPIYAYYFEKLTGLKVSGLAYALFPKVMIREKKTETLETFRLRLLETLRNQEINIFDVPYDKQKVIDHFELTQKLLTAETYPKNITKLCDWCDFKALCWNGDDTMVLPSTARREIDGVSRKKLWLYGAPFSGKTTLANAFETPLMLNTDGNIKFVDSPYVHVKNRVEKDGRITKITSAWEVFTELVDELEKGSDFKTVIVDLTEDFHEHARTYVLDKNGWTHETDGGFGAGWKKVESEFLNTFKRLLNLDYNIVLISHEDTSKDLTRKGGDKITSIKPNLSEKLANKLAGMVDVVARAVVVDGVHELSFKTDEVQFGGGRLKIERDVVPMTIESINDLYENQPQPGEISTPVEKPVEKKTRRSRTKDVEPEVEVEEVETEIEQIVEAVESAPVTPARRRGRPRKSDPVEPVEDVFEDVENDSEESDDVEPEPETPKRTRKSRAVTEPEDDEDEVESVPEVVTEDDQDVEETYELLLTWSLPTLKRRAIDELGMTRAELKDWTKEQIAAEFYEPSEVEVPKTKRTRKARD